MVSQDPPCRIGNQYRQADGKGEPGPEGRHLESRPDRGITSFDQAKREVDQNEDGKHNDRDRLCKGTEIG